MIWGWKKATHLLPSLPFECENVASTKSNYGPPGSSLSLCVINIRSSHSFRYLIDSILQTQFLMRSLGVVSHTKSISRSWLWRLRKMSIKRLFFKASKVENCKLWFFSLNAVSWVQFSRSEITNAWVSYLSRRGTLVGRSCAKAPFKNACPSLVDSVPPPCALHSTPLEFSIVNFSRVSCDQKFSLWYQKLQIETFICFSKLR